MNFQLLAIGPANPSRQLGDRVLLSTGRTLALLHRDGTILIYRTIGLHGSNELWTEHMECPGLYARVCDWPHGPCEVIDMDEVVYLALMEQLRVASFLALEMLAPLDNRRAPSLDEMA